MPDEKIYFTEAIPTEVVTHATALRKACLEWPTTPVFPKLDTPGLGTHLNICLATRKPSLLNRVEQNDKALEAKMIEGAMYGAGGATALLVTLLILVALVRRWRRPKTAGGAHTINVPVRSVVQAEPGAVINEQAMAEFDVNARYFPAQAGMLPTIKVSI